MIKILVKTSSKIESINLKGHAESNNYGKDLVCAGVSSIVFGMLNSLDKKHVDITVLKNEININSKDSDKKMQILLEALYISLKTIEDQNKKFIKIIREVNYDIKN